MQSVSLLTLAAEAMTESTIGGQLQGMAGKRQSAGKARTSPPRTPPSALRNPTPARKKRDSPGFSCGPLPRKTGPPHFFRVQPG